MPSAGSYSRISKPVYAWPPPVEVVSNAMYLPFPYTKEQNSTLHVNIVALFDVITVW